MTRPRHKGGLPRKTPGKEAWHLGAIILLIGAAMLLAPINMIVIGKIKNAGPHRWTEVRQIHTPQGP